jgi:hypothetical protein
MWMRADSRILAYAIPERIAQNAKVVRVETRDDFSSLWSVVLL